MFFESLKEYLEVIVDEVMANNGVGIISEHHT